jgi:D-3-phosphoglycerate dehydrogenase
MLGSGGIVTACQSRHIASSAAVPQIRSNSGIVGGNFIVAGIAMQTSYPRQDIKVLLLEGVSASAIDVFHRAGYSLVELHAKSLPEDELKRRIGDAHIIGIRSRTQLTADVLAQAKRLMAVGCFCIGTNQVDLGAARKLGVPVFNAPYSNTRSVAELVIAEAIMLLRGIPQKNAQCHRGGWSKSASGSYETRDKVLGIVGYGHIGTQVGVLAESLGMRVIFHDIETKLSLGNARAVSSLDELLERADVVTLHVPETPATQMMIRREQLAKMRKGAMLINASRGSVVDIDALAAALRDGHLSGAAVDVFPLEPKGNDDAFVSPLVGMDNVILTPHIGGSTLEAQDNIGIEVASKLIRYSDNGSTLSAVNFPEVTLPEHPHSRRLLHIHRNVPGVLSRINELFSAGNINIDAQFLQTDSEVGYVVIDVSADEPQANELKANLATIPGTLRSRVLY